MEGGGETLQMFLADNILYPLMVACEKSEIFRCVFSAKSSFNTDPMTKEKVWSFFNLMVCHRPQVLWLLYLKVGVTIDEINEKDLFSL